MNRTDQFQEIRDIADCICNDEVSPDQIKQLESLLTGNDDAQKFYAEYIGMHVHMSAPAEPALEVIKRRIQVEEVIVRPIGSTGDVAHPTSNVNNTNHHQLGQQLSQNHGVSVTHTGSNSTVIEKLNSPKLKFLFLSLLSLLILFSFIFNLLKETDNHIGEIISGKLTINGAGQISANHIYTGEYIADQLTLIRLTSGDILELGHQSTFKLFNLTQIQLIEGSIAIEEPTGNNISIIAPTFTMQSSGSSLNINVDANLSTVTTGINSFLIPQRWRPQHYWSFDSNSDRARDLAGNATGIPGKGAFKVKGLVGNGAFEFDNSLEARINVGSGGGTAPATGSFAVTDGVTIEALIITQYTGEPGINNGRGELDEIFRKDQSDKEHRMLLSFQNDSGKKTLMPKGDFNESLSFGLYLVGQGYHELKLPLDGKNGRPTLEQLKDNRARHIVATYNVSTGLKAIYIDGIMLAHYQYPAGSKMLSGGSGMANIGNSPNAINNDSEAFSGIIDEVAFYNFALPDYMIRHHFNSFQQGLNYFGLKPGVDYLPKKRQIQLANQQTFIIDPTTGLPASLKQKTSAQ